jgi:type IV pilus assembly protein PilW
MTRALHRRAGQRGLSLVELMVGITVGLIVVAAASLLLSGQLTDNRLLVAEAQVQQDLRATADIIVRELRRAGMNNRPQASVWDPAAAGDPQANPFTANTTLAPAEGESDDIVQFAYRDADVGLTGPLGFRLNAGTGALESLQRSGAWQELTDRNTINVTGFTVTRLPDTRAIVPCPNACPGGGTDCWPRMGVRAFELVITAQSRSAPQIVRRHQATVRIRNDDLPFNDPDPASARLCPA